MKTIVLLLILSSFTISAQTTEGYKNFDVTAINEELKQLDDETSFTDVLIKYGSKMPRDYIINGEDSYYSSTIKSVNTSRQHLKNMDHPLLKELKTILKTVKNDDGIIQILSYQESYLCKNATAWSDVACVE